MVILETLQNQHKNLINKFNHDIFMANYGEAEKNINHEKSILENEKMLHKELLSKK